MQLNNLQPVHRSKRSKRVGRGGKRGTFSGRGTKGQGARAGAKIRPAARDIVKKIPKLRGYKFKAFRAREAVVNLAAIERHFKEGDVVSPATLKEAGLVRRVNGRLPEVKILGTGALTKNVKFHAVRFSKAVSEKHGEAARNKA